MLRAMDLWPITGQIFPFSLPRDLFILMRGRITWGHKPMTIEKINIGTQNVTPLAFVLLHVAFTSYSFPPSAMVSLSWSLLLRYMERVRKPIVSRVKISNKCVSRIYVLNWQKSSEMRLIVLGWGYGLKGWAELKGKPWQTWKREHICLVKSSIPGLMPQKQWLPL